MTLAEAILRDFEAERANTRKLLEAVPEARFDWKPHEKSMSLAALAGHVAEAPSWIDAMEADSFEMENADGGDYTPFVPANAEELMAAFEKNADGFEVFLDGRDDAFMGSIWTMTVGGEQVMSMPRDAVIRSMMLHHVSHHRGQLTVYLRLLDVGVPPTYGPTADNPRGF